MHKIDYSALHLETFTKQKHCDVFFSCENSEGEWKTIGAHKFLLMSVSDVFETMFYGKAVENNRVKQEDVIKVKDISMKTFQSFLRYIYGGIVTFTCAESAAEFYAACDKYNCKDGLIFAENYMIEKVCPQNVITFLETGDLYDLPKLKTACWKVIFEQTKDVLYSSKFLTAKTEMIQLIFQQDDITIGSENDLVVALEWYINHHKRYDPEIAAKVRPALNCIRFLTLTAEEIAKTSLLSDKESRDVIKCLPPAKDLSKMPPSFNLNSEKRSGKKIQFKDDVIVLIKALYGVFHSSFCNYCSVNGYSNNHAPWNCCSCSMKRKSELQKIYSKYNHSFLMEYSSADIKTIYDIYKLNGQI